ncbi:hypothetical protein FHS41_007454 [Streptomyces violarus]|uniref:Uncharacterized protein n=1 Tax=Streptomyces violarus TaxID=67380 RepID=A0A7W4ZY40_9ACTN|nr:hypothetical protein [Streptomyces violarus]MBB3080900.1 hypothetical protein [Streptomyces violarus]
MRTHHARAAKALGVQTEPGGEFWGWAGRTLGARVRTATGVPAWLRLVSAPEAKASGKLWDGALDAQHAFGDLDRHRPPLLGVHDAVDDAVAYRAELLARVDQPILSGDPILQHDLRLPHSWWTDLAGVLGKVSVAGTDRVAVRHQYMDRAIPEFVGIPAPAVTAWTTAHGDLHWANLTEPLQILGWEGWGRAPVGIDAAMLYAYTLLQPDTAACVRDVFPALGSQAGLAAEATVCAQLLQTVARGDNLPLEIPTPQLGCGTAPSLMERWPQEVPADPFSTSSGAPSRVGSALHDLGSSSGSEPGFHRPAQTRFAGARARTVGRADGSLAVEKCLACLSVLCALIRSTRRVHVTRVVDSRCSDQTGDYNLRSRSLLAIGAVTLGLLGSHLGLAQAAGEPKTGVNTSLTTGVALTDDPVADEASLESEAEDGDPDAAPSAEDLALGADSTAEGPEAAPETAEDGERVGLDAGRKATCDERVKDAEDQLHVERQEVEGGEHARADEQAGPR